MSKIKDGVNVTKDTTNAALRAIAEAVKSRVLVGVPQEETERSGDKSQINNATIGYIQEFGSPAANIPARPHLIPGVRESISRVEPHLKDAAKAALNNNQDEVFRKLSSAGLIAQNTVRANVNAGVAPALKDSTLAARRSRGRTGDVPLIDTGQYRNSITYVVRKDNA